LAPRPLRIRRTLKQRLLSVVCATSCARLPTCDVTTAASSAQVSLRALVPPLWLLLLPFNGPANDRASCDLAFAVVVGYAIFVSLSVGRAPLHDGFGVPPGFCLSPASVGVMFHCFWRTLMLCVSCRGLASMPR